MTNRITALLRTVVPSLWGSLLVWLGAQVALPEPVSEFLANEATVAFLVALAIGSWYAFWTWLQPKLPDWLIRIVLGAAATPSYVRAGDPQASVYTSTITGEQSVHVRTASGEQHFSLEDPGAIE